MYTFLKRRCTLYDYDVKLPNFTRPLYKVGEHNLIFFCFSKLITNALSCL